MTNGDTEIEVIAVPCYAADYLSSICGRALLLPMLAPPRKIEKQYLSSGVDKQRNLLREQGQTLIVQQINSGSLLTQRPRSICGKAPLLPMLVMPRKIEKQYASSGIDHQGNPQREQGQILLIQQINRSIAVPCSSNARVPSMAKLHSSPCSCHHGRTKSNTHHQE